MNNDDQDMQPQMSQAADNENEDIAGDNMMDMNGDEAGDETATQAAPDGGMDTMAGDTGATDDNTGDADMAGDADATTDADVSNAVAVSDTDAIDDAGSIGDADAAAADMASDADAGAVDAGGADSDMASDGEASGAVDDAAGDVDAGDVETAAADDRAGDADAGDVEASAGDADMTGDATDMGASDMAAMSTSDTGATDAAADNAASDDSPATIIAEEARDEQDAQMPGEVETPAEVEAAPQIAQASETSQAEGESEADDTAGTPVDMGETAAVEAPDMGVGAGDGAVMSDGTSAEEAEADSSYEEPIVRSTRLQDVSADASMEDLLRASEQQYRTLKHGDVVEGTVMKVGRDEILVDIGAKTEGIIPSAELQSLTTEEREALAIGDPLLVSVVQTENNEGHAVLSLDRARQERSWRDLQKRFEAGEVIQARVTGYNKGGLLVNLEGVRGFVPSSQISSLTGGPEAQKQSEMAKLQNQTIPMKIIEINRSRNRLILSERQAMQEQRESVRSRLLRELEPGQVRQGRVSSICDFGAFVDIGGADGLIHLSEISWKRVGHPSDVLKVGDTVNVYVLSVDPNERKIALSLKRTQPEPWSTITENYKLGQIVRGTITQLTTFGAFARLDDGIEGLIHVSELAEGRVAHPKNVVNVGDTLDLKVIRIDPAKRRIGLSLKRVNEDENAPVPTGEDGEETAPGEAPTMGASGEEHEPSMGQVETTEAASMQVEQEASEPSTETQPEPRMSERPERQERSGGREQQPRNQGQQGQDRGQDRRGQNQNRQQPAPSGNESSGDEPMGALAQALGAFMNREDEEEES